MKNTLIILLGVFLTSACSTSRFDYQTAYKFSQYQYENKSEPVSIELLTSLNPMTQITPDLPSDKALRALAAPEKIATAFMEQYRNASKLEKKAIRKQVKEEYRSLRVEAKKAQKDAANQDITFNQKMYIGLVVFAAGILIAILASGPVGAVAIIVGIGLIAWGFIEQA